jgi:hypothetical protein
MAKPQRRRSAPPRRAFDFDEMRADQLRVIRQKCSGKSQARLIPRARVLFRAIAKILIRSAPQV